VADTKSIWWAELERLRTGLAQSRKPPGEAELRAVLDLTERVLDATAPPRKEQAGVGRHSGGLANLLRSWTGRRAAATNGSVALEMDPLYAAWIREQEPRIRARELGRPKRPRWPAVPVFDLLLVLRSPKRGSFQLAVDSIRSQTWPNWKLCVLAVTPEFWVKPLLEELAAADPRFTFVLSPDAMSDAEAANQALTMGSGDYVALVGEEDQLEPDALQRLADSLAFSPAEVLYTDEDLLNAKLERAHPLFKPDWSPELLLSRMYIGRLFVVARFLLERLHGFRDEYSEACEYDLALRLMDEPIRVRHVPLVLYHRAPRRSDSETANFVRRAERLALKDAARQRGWSITIDDGPVPRSYTVRRTVENRPKVSLIAPVMDQASANAFRATIDLTSYEPREIVLVQHIRSSSPALAEEGAVLTVAHFGPFHLGTQWNAGAAAASGEVLVFLHDDVVPQDKDWLDPLVAQALRPGVGVVGPMFTYPSGKLQQAGVVIGAGDGILSLHRGADSFGYWPWSNSARNVSAVGDPCLVMRREVFRKLNGFDPGFPNRFAAADLCLRARSSGCEVIFEPASQLVHAERGRRPLGASFDEMRHWLSRWGDVASDGDPYYNPNLSRSSEDCTLRFDYSTG